MWLCLNGVPAGKSRIVRSSAYSHPLAEIGVDASSRRSRTVSLAVDLLRVAAGYASSDCTVLGLSKTMYSYEGPVMLDPSAFFATGTVIVSPSVAPISQPLPTTV